MAKKILSVGVEIPGGEVEQVESTSKRSLLDADVVIFAPEIPGGTYAISNYRGRPSLDDYASFQAREFISHWRRELKALVEAGRLVIVLLRPPEIVYVATGDIQRSGTGRNAQSTRIVEPLNSYEALPVGWGVEEASGAEMSIVPTATFFAAYWKEFAEFSAYEAFLTGEVREPIVKTRIGNRIVAAIGRGTTGAILAIPNLQLDDESFSEEREEDGETEIYWSKKGITFGRRLASALVSVVDAIRSESENTAPPTWATEDSVFWLPKEDRIRRDIEEITAQISSLELKHDGLNAQLLKAGGLRALLYEQGKPLERAVLDALTLFGFDARAYENAGSEFDAVFTSAEGRFLGEVEGKDNRAVNIDKFSQLERNLNEDFQRDEVMEFAKGVLFGNAYRLTAPDERRNAFTDKCQTAAKRLGVALVQTPDLFGPARYLQSNMDLGFAEKCRQAIFSASGEIVVFPSPPS